MRVLCCLCSTAEHNPAHCRCDTAGRNQGRRMLRWSVYSCTSVYDRMRLCQVYVGWKMLRCRISCTAGLDWGVTILPSYRRQGLLMVDYRCECHGDQIAQMRGCIACIPYICLLVGCCRDQKCLSRPHCDYISPLC